MQFHWIGNVGNILNHLIEILCLDLLSLMHTWQYIAISKTPLTKNGISALIPLSVSVTQTVSSVFWSRKWVLWPLHASWYGDVSHKLVIIFVSYPSIGKTMPICIQQIVTFNVYTLDPQSYIFPESLYSKDFNSTEVSIIYRVG